MFLNNFYYTLLKGLLLLFKNVFIHTFEEFILENYHVTLEMKNVIYFQKNQVSFFQTLSQGKKCSLHLHVMLGKVFELSQKISCFR